MSLRIKNLLIAVLLALNTQPLAVFADSTNRNELIGVGVHAEVASKIDQLYLQAIRASQMPAVNNAVDVGSLAKEFRTGYFGAIVQNPSVPLAAATPVTGTNFCAPGICAVPTNAANNAVFVGVATPVVGTEFYIKNLNATNLVRAKVAGGATINNAVAGGYIGLAALTSMHCIYYSLTDLTCDTYSNSAGTTAALPTPAGP